MLSGHGKPDRAELCGRGWKQLACRCGNSRGPPPYEKLVHLQQEKVALLRAQAGEQAARSLIRVEVSRAYFEHQSAGRQVEVARSAMAQAAESLRILRTRYDAGLVTLTDVLRAEDADRQSQSGYWQAVYHNASSYAALRLATGTLNVDEMVNFQ